MEEVTSGVEGSLPDNVAALISSRDSNPDQAADCEAVLKSDLVEVLAAFDVMAGDTQRNGHWSVENVRIEALENGRISISNLADQIGASGMDIGVGTGRLNNNLARLAHVGTIGDFRGTSGGFNGGPMSFTISPETFDSLAKVGGGIVLAPPKHNDRIGG